MENIGVNLPYRDFLLDVAMGRIKGYQQDFIVGITQQIPKNEEVTIWDLADLGVAGGGVLTRLTSETELFASSTSAGDTTSQVFVNGLDGNFNAKQTITTLTGQSQVSVGDFLHVQSATITTASALGDVYISESDALTAGVPNDKTKIKSKIFASMGITHNGFFLVPADKSVITISSRVSSSITKVGKLSAVKTFVTGLGAPTIQSNTFHVSGFEQLNFMPVATSVIFGQNVTILPEKSFIEFRVEAESVDEEMFFASDIIVVDTPQFSLIND